MGLHVDATDKHATIALERHRRLTALKDDLVVCPDAHATTICVRVDDELLSLITLSVQLGIQRRLGHGIFDKRYHDRPLEGALLEDQHNWLRAGDCALDTWTVRHAA
jgi:hypothetical protein